MDAFGSAAQSIIGSQTRRAMLGASDRAACAASDKSGWSRRSFLGVTAALAAGTVAGCATSGSRGPVSESIAQLGATPGRKRRTATDPDYKQGPPYALDAQCVLSEDYFLVENHPIDPDHDTVIAYSRADGEVEAVVLQDDVVRQVYRDPSQTGGWQVFPLPNATGVKSMVAAVSSGSGSGATKQMLKVYYTSNATTDPSNKDKLFEVTMHLDAPGQVASTRTLDWSAGAGDLQISANYDGSLLVAAMEESPSNGGSATLHYATDWMGPARAGSIHGFDFTGWDNGSWAAVGAVIGEDSESGPRPSLLLYFPGNLDPESGPTGLQVRGGPMEPVPTGWGSFDAKLWFGELPTGPNNGQGIVKAVEYVTTLGSLYGGYGWPTVLVWTQQYNDEIGFYGHPWLWSLTYDPTLPYTKWVWTDLQVPHEITDSPLNIPVTTALVPRSTSPADGKGAAHLMDVFIALDGTLHVLRQVEQADAAADSRHPVYTPMIPLQPGVATMTSQPAVSAGNELMVVGSDHTLQTLEKDPISGRWTDAVVHLQASEMQQDSSYRVTATLTDTLWNAAVTSHGVTITASTPAVAAVEGPTPRTVLLGADPVTVSTDHDGEVTLALLADGLSAPTLTFTTAGLPNPFKVCPSAPVNTYMQGGTKLNYLDKMDATTLASAKDPDGNLVAPNVTSDKDNTVQTMQTAATWGTDGEKDGTVSATVGRPDGNRKRPHGHARRHGPQTPTTQLTSELNAWAHDALHAIKKGALAVKTLTVDVDQKMVEFASDAANWANNTIQVFVKGIEDAAHVLHAAINKLAGEIEHAVKWLVAEVLDVFRDSNHLAGTFDRWIKDFTDFAGTQLAAGETKAETWLKNEQKDVTEKLTALRDRYPHDGKKTVILANMADNSPGRLGTRGRPSPGRPPAANPPRDSDDDQDKQPHGDWFWRKIKHELTRLDKQLNLPSGDLSQKLKKFTSHDAGGFQNAYHAKFWETFILSVVKHPTDVDGIVVYDLLDALINIVSEAFGYAEAVVADACDLLRDVAAAVTGMLDTPLQDLPILGGLMKLILIGDVTIGHVANLLFAFPATLTYKIAHGAKAVPFPGTAVGTKRGHQLGDVATDLQICAASVMGTWAVFDTTSAAFVAGGDDGGMLFTSIDIVAPLMVTILTVPDTKNGEPYYSPPVTGKAADLMAFFAWLLGAYPAFTTASVPFAKMVLASGAKEFEQLALWNQTLSGVLALVFGMVANGLKDSPKGADYAGAVLNNMSTLSGAGLTDLCIEGSGGLSVVVTMALTLVCGGLGAAVYGVDG